MATSSGHQMFTSHSTQRAPLFNVRRTTCACSMQHINFSTSLGRTIEMSLYEPDMVYFQTKLNILAVGAVKSCTHTLFHRKTSTIDLVGRWVEWKELDSSVAFCERWTLCGLRPIHILGVYHAWVCGIYIKAIFIVCCASSNAHNASKPVRTIHTLLPSLSRPPCEHEHFCLCAFLER